MFSLSRRGDVEGALRRARSARHRADIFCGVGISPWFWAFGLLSQYRSSPAWAAPVVRARLQALESVSIPAGLLSMFFRLRSRLLAGVLGSPLQILHDTTAQGLPAIMHAAGGMIVAFRKAGRAAFVVGEAVHGVNDHDERDVRGGYAEGKAPGGALAAAQKTLPRQLLKDLGQKVGGDGRVLGNLSHHGVLALRHACQVDESANRIFRGARVDHEHLLRPR